MRLLDQIQETAIQTDFDVAALLRQCKVLAYQLKNEQFKQWVDWELDGYPSVDVLPSYRVLNVESHGHFAGPFQSELRNAPLPPINLPEGSRHIANKAYLVESISSYATMVEKADGAFQIQWPADAILAFQDEFFEHMKLLRAWKVISRGALRAVIDTVKNRVLGFALDLSAEFSGADAIAGTNIGSRVGDLFAERIRVADKIFIGHGRSSVWKDLWRFLTERLNLRCDEFNGESTAGLSVKQRLNEMLESAKFAFLVMTGEDEVDGGMRARENVVHELGLFQGRLGFEKAIILLEDGCSRFSNIDGLVYIPFAKGRVDAASEEIRRVLEREGVLRA